MLHPQLLTITQATSVEPLVEYAYNLTLSRSFDA